MLDATSNQLSEDLTGALLVEPPTRFVDSPRDGTDSENLKAHAH